MSLSDPAAPHGAPVLSRHDVAPPAPTAPVATVTEHPMTFTGTAGEYFRIWIVNVALTVVTLGVYLPWARVRTRQYFYGHTWVDGQNFEYRANPMALLRGYLLVGFLFAVYALSSNSERTIWISIVLALLYAALYPWVVRQSMRFQAVNTWHRGLNFHFLGTLKGSYFAYGVANVAAGVIGLLLPWAWHEQRKYQVQNLTYGQARGAFRGDVAPFFTFWITAVGIGVGSLLLIGVPLLALFFTSGSNPFEEDGFSTGLIVALGLGYVLFLLLSATSWQYVRGAIMKYVLNNAELGGVVRFRASFSPWRLAWIGVTNTLAQLLTLGLATPWAAMRRAKYVTEGITVRTITNLDEFASAGPGQESALGEAATELLDIQVGF